MQFVVNLNTGAWGRFTGQDAQCWGLLEGDLYFGGNTKVYKADNGLSDPGTQMQGMQTTFVYYGGRGTSKRFTAIRPIVSSDADLPVSIGFDVTLMMVLLHIHQCYYRWSFMGYSYMEKWAGTIASQLCGEVLPI